MSRFTVTILLACVLLGMLLWIVLSTVAELANPEPLVVLETETPTVAFDPALPVIERGDELLAWLADTGMDDDVAVNRLNNYRYWLEARGYRTADMWLSAGAPALAALPPELPAEDDALLIALAGSGDERAAALLGETSMRDNPVAALDWFDQAIVNGSVHAMVRSADVLTSLGDPALTTFRSNEVWEQALTEIRAQDPLVQALAWNIAAVIVGGYGVLDVQLEERITQLAARLDPASTDKACTVAQELVLDTAMARRAQGGAVFSTERPPLAVSVAEPDRVLPCDVPVLPLVVMDDCRSDTFVGPGPRLWQMYVCPSP